MHGVLHALVPEKDRRTGSTCGWGLWSYGQSRLVLYLLASEYLQVPSMSDNRRIFDVAVGAVLVRAPSKMCIFSPNKWCVMERLIRIFF